MATLWLVRHAQPVVAPGVCYGRLDVPAEVLHTQQCAAALSQALQAQGKELGLSALLTSPLQRCAALASALGQQLELPVRQDARLAEMDFGVWEGVPWTDIPKAALDAWTDNFAHHAFGGQECTRQVLERVWSALMDAQRAGGTHLWITHAGVIRAVQHLLAQGQPTIASAQEWPRESPGYGGWVCVELPHAL